MTVMVINSKAVDVVLKFRKNNKRNKEEGRNQGKYKDGLRAGKN